MTRTAAIPNPSTQYAISSDDRRQAKASDGTRHRVSDLIDKYTNVDYGKEAQRQGRLQTLYKGLGYFSLGVIAALVTLVIAAVILYTLAIASPAVAVITTAAFTASCYNAKGALKERLFAPLQHRAQLAQAKSELYLGYQQSIDATKKEGLPLSQTEVLKTLSHYWETKAKNLEDDREKLTGEIETAKKTEAPVDTQKQQQARDDALYQRLLRKHHLEEGDIPAAKLNAAFLGHLATHPEETREARAFYTAHPRSLRGALMDKAAQKAGAADQAYLTLSDGTEWTAQQLLEEKIETIRKKIFGDDTKQLG